MRRTLTSLAILGVATWFGSVVGGCFIGGRPCRCPPPPTLVSKPLKVTSSTLPELMGAEADITREGGVIRYTVDGAPRELRFTVTTH